MQSSFYSRKAVKAGTITGYFADKLHLCQQVHYIKVLSNCRSDLREKKFPSFYWNPWFWHLSQSFYSCSDTETQWETDLGVNPPSQCAIAWSPQNLSKGTLLTDHCMGIDWSLYGYWLYSPYRVAKAPQAFVATSGLQSQGKISPCSSLPLLSSCENSVLQQDSIYSSHLRLRSV